MGHVLRRRAGQLIGRLCHLPEEQVSTCISWTKTREYGDLALSVPQLASLLGCSDDPNRMAQHLAAECPQDELFDSVKSAGCYVNFKANGPRLANMVIDEVLNSKERFGHSTVGQGQSLAVDFSSPNIAKPFHAGHLRSTIIGNFVCNVSRAQGYKVVGINYLGDWGKQYGLLAVGYDKFGNEEKLATDPIGHLYDVYVNANRLAKDDDSVHQLARNHFKKMEDGDQAALDQWELYRRISVNQYKKTYSRLNVHFDQYEGESMATEAIPGMLSDLQAHGLIRMDADGSAVADLTDQGLGVAVIRRRDGTALYLTRDLCTAVRRKKVYNCDWLVYVVGQDQTLHFRQLQALLRGLGHQWADSIEHVSFGPVKGMSTRKGSAVFLDDVLNEAQSRMLIKMKQTGRYKVLANPEATAAQLGLSAVVIQDLKSGRAKGYAFDWDRMLQAEGDTGPYLQYQHVRVASIKKKTGAQPTANIDGGLLSEPQAQLMLRQIAIYPEVVSHAFETREACHVVQHAFKLARLLSSAHNSLYVMEQPTAVAEARLALYEAARQTLANTFELVGLEALTSM